MRKFLFALASILILTLTIYVIIAGVSFAKINGYKKINQINGELDLKITAINALKDKAYVTKRSELDTETKLLQETREEYLAKVEAARIKGAKGSKLQLEVYDLSFIWGRMGNYASNLDLEIKLDVFPGTEEETLHDFKLYNLELLILGNYTDIVRFIYKIEGDEQLSAQLSDFSMTTGASTEESANNEESEETEESTSGLALQALLTWKNIPLNYKNIIEDSTTSDGTSIDDLNLLIEINSNEEDTETESDQEEVKGIEETGLKEEDIDSILE